MLFISIITAPYWGIIFGTMNNVMKDLHGEFREITPTAEGKAVQDNIYNSYQTSSGILQGYMVIEAFIIIIIIFVVIFLWFRSQSGSV